MNNTIRIAAPAKVNLFLHVTGKRADGYHLIDSLAVFTDFGDQLEISASDNLSLNISGSFAQLLSGDNSDNLVIKAARLLQEHSGCRKGAQITLHKNIPVGAGLGGGSSDAAATMIGLMRLWEIKPDIKELAALALQLGSDVPVCLARRMAHIRGIGEEVVEVAVPYNSWENYCLVLVNPGAPLLTADVYRRFSGKFSPPPDLDAAGSLEKFLNIIVNSRNSLENPAMQLLPVVGDVVSAIASTDECIVARMSGSGATCFGLYKSETLAKQAVLDLKRLHPAWWVQATSWHKDI